MSEMHEDDATPARESAGDELLDTEDEASAPTEAAGPAPASATDPAGEATADEAVHLGDEPPEIPWALAAVAGVLASGLALGAGELLSGISGRIPSLVTRVGDIVIDNAPGSVERWAIDTFGTNDKPALVIGITIISLLIGAATGVAAARRFRAAWAVFAIFGLVGALAAGSDPQRSAGWGWFAAIVATLVGVGSLRLLFGSATSSLLSLRVDDGHEPLPGSRRTFVTTATAAAAVGVAAPVIGIALRNRQVAAVEEDRELVADVLDQLAAPTPAPVPETPDLSATTDISGMSNFDDVDGITPIIVPNDEFYRIDTALVVPRLDVETWSMKVTGMVDEEIELTFDDLLAMDPVEEFVTLSCVSNRVGGDLVGNARWLGVPIRRLLDMAGVQPGASQIVGRSVDGWTGGFPTTYLDDPNRVALVAVAMNGEPLPVEHGFPVRLVVAGLYGYVSATKWLKEIELTTLEGFDGYWIPRGWSKLGPVKTQSRIDLPRPNATVAPGPQAIAGVAWAPDRGVDKVEVQVMEITDTEILPAPWIEAELSADITDNSWRQWYVEWDASAGDHLIRVRATDGAGQTQTEMETPVAPDGATGWHTIAVRAR